MGFLSSLFSKNASKPVEAPVSYDDLNEALLRQVRDEYITAAVKKFKGRGNEITTDDLYEFLNNKVRKFGENAGMNFDDTFRNNYVVSMVKETIQLMGYKLKTQQVEEPEEPVQRAQSNVQHGTMQRRTVAKPERARNNNFKTAKYAINKFYATYLGALYLNMHFGGTANANYADYIIRVVNDPDKYTDELGLSETEHRNLVQASQRVLSGRVKAIRNFDDNEENVRVIMLRMEPSYPYAATLGNMISAGVYNDNITGNLYNYIQEYDPTSPLLNEL